MTTYDPIPIHWPLFVPIHKEANVFVKYDPTCGAKFYNLHSSYLPQWLHI